MAEKAEKKLNIAIVIDDMGMGGAQHIVYELIKNINPQIYKVTIVCTNPRGYSILENKILNEGYNVIFLNLYKYLQVFGLYFVLRKIKPDIVHAHQRGILAIFWALFNGVYLITTIHTNPQACFKWWFERFFFKISMLLRRNIVVAISEYNQKLIKDYWHLNDKYARFINNGIDIPQFFHKSHDFFSFINASRQDKNKNQILILKAFLRLFNEHKDIKLYLIGDGEERQKLKTFAAVNGLEQCVIFTGFLESPKEYFANCDVYISSSNREGLSLSVLEGMASELAVIATDAGGVRDLARENGILIPVNDEQALYNAMKKLYEDRLLCAQMGKKSIEMVQNYSSVNMAKEYCLLYEKFAKER